jgi:hypothetical protein
MIINKSVITFYTVYVRYYECSIKTVEHCCDENFNCNFYFEIYRHV